MNHRYLTDCKEKIQQSIRQILLNKYLGKNYDKNHIYKDFEVELYSYDWSDEGGGGSFDAIRVYGKIVTLKGNNERSVNVNLTI